MSEIQYIWVEKLWVEETSVPAVLEVAYMAPETAGEDWRYQLCVNGVFADVSDDAGQRAFTVHAADYPQMFAILAVPPQAGMKDFSGVLPQWFRNPSWVCMFRMTQDTAFEPGDRIEVYHDDATGRMSDKPALRWQVWPPATLHGGWGTATLMNAGFGIDGSNAPGMSAPFGIGPMGLGGYELQAVLPLCSNGTHDIHVIARRSDGGMSDASELLFHSSVPPTRAGRLTFVNHNPYTGIAKFKIN